MSDLMDMSSTARRAVAIGCGALLAVAGWFLIVAPLLSGDSATASNALSDPSGSDEAAITVQDDAADDLPMPEVTYDIVLGRDPFDPVRPAAPEDPATGTDGNGNGGETNGDGTDGGSNGGTNGGTGAAPGEGVDKDPPPELDLSVVAVAVDGDGLPVARLRLGTTEYIVAVGETFVTGYRLTAISGSCVTVTTPSGTVNMCVGDPAVTTGGSASGGAINCAGQAVSLVSANPSAESAVIRVGSDTYAVGVGEQFAGSFQLLSVADSAVRVISGDVLCVVQAGGAQQK